MELDSYCHLDSKNYNGDVSTAVSRSVANEDEGEGEGEAFLPMT